MAHQDEMDKMNIDWQLLRVPAAAIGDILADRYPATDTEPPMIPQQAVEDITVQLVTVIAEVIQSWIDAGSEREVTMENETLYRAIYDELKGWSDHADNAPAA